MGQHYAQKLAYSYDFKSEEMQPLIESQILQKDDILSFMKDKEISEPLQGSVKDESLSLTEIQDDINDMTNTSMSSSQSGSDKEENEDKRYALSYYNPSTGKSEVFAIISNIKIKDYTKKVVDEAVGMLSSYPIYSFIASPIMGKEVNPYVLQQIRDNIEYITPPRFGGVARIKPVVVSKVVAVDKQEKSRNAVVEVVRRKELTEKRVEEELVLLEKAVEDVRSNKNPISAVERLPALSRARFVEAMRKKKLSSSSLLALLEKDVSFLKTIKSKLRALSLDDLLDLARTMRKLKEK